MCDFQHWLQTLKREPEIGALPIGDSERSEPLSRLLDIATAIGEEKEFSAEDRSSYLRYDAIRYQQRYTIPLLIREGKLLQPSIADYLQRTFAQSEMIHIVPETVRLMATIESLWNAAARGFIQQAHAV